MTFVKGSIVISPHTAIPWEPMRVTEVAPQGSVQMVRIAKLASAGWMHASGFLPAPKYATFDLRTGRWMRDGVDVTPKLADLG